MKATIRVKQSYDFFEAKSSQNEEFTLDELREYTGWSEATVRTYPTKKWESILERVGDKFRVVNLPPTLDEYLRLMSQKDMISNDPKKPILPLEVERLVVKAREAAILALDIYNRPATIFKTEGFIVMMVIAWTALFHAIFEKRGVFYFYRHKDGTPVEIDNEYKAWELKTCIKEFYGDSNNPIRSNLDFIIGLRNKIEHRYVPAIDLHVAGECQALLLNLDDLISDQFGDYYALKEFLAVPLQTASVRTGSQAEALRKYQGRQYDAIKDYIDAYRSELPTEIYADPRFSFRVYLVPKIGNHASSSDLAFEFVKHEPDNDAEYQSLANQIALIKEKRVPVANPGKFKPSTVAKIVSEKIGRHFSTHNHTQAWRYYEVRQSGETPEGCNVKYCQFDDVHRDYVYTQEWIDFLVRKLSDEVEYERVTSTSLR